MMNIMSGSAQTTITSPTSKAETDARIAAKSQLTDAPTVYIWMLDAKLNKKATKPQEYSDVSDVTGDKNDLYYLIKMQGGVDYDTQISNNIIAADPTITDGAAILPNYGQYEEKSDQYRLARIKVVDANGSIKLRDELTTIRGRGNSTWVSPKKSYRLKFSSKTKLLAQGDGTNNYADAKNWTLLANVADKTMMRNALTAEVGKRIEQKTGVKGLPYNPAYKFVDVVMNDEYIGTYQISDHTQIHKGRIEIDEDNGWLLEAVSTNSNFIEDIHVVMSYNDSYKYAVNVKNPEDDFYTAEVEQSISDFLNAAYACTFSKDFSEATGLFKYVDMESLVAYFIGNEVSGNYDGLISNYAYRDINPDDKLHFGPLWDFDIAYGNYGDLREGFIFERGKDWGWDGWEPYLRTCVKNLVENSPEFVNLLVKRWEQVYASQPGNWPTDNGLTNSMYYRIQDINTAMEQSRTLNYTSKEAGGAGWTTSEDYLGWVYGSTFDSYDAAKNALWQFIQDHNHWLEEAVHELKANLTLNTTFTIDANAPTVNMDDCFGKICDVQISNRTFEAGEWNTICLPFSLSHDQLKATFGEDVELLEYSAIVGSTMLFLPAADTRLVAGIPYLIKPSGNDVVNPSFSQMPISCRTPVTVSYAENNAFGFKGIFSKTSISTDGTTMLLDASQEQFAANTSANDLVGLGAYITCPVGQSSMPVFAVVALSDGADNTKALSALEGKTVNVKIDGRTLYKDGYWNTLSLPFSLESFDGTILSDATVMELDKTSFSGSTLTINFKTATKIKAGKPYIVKWDGNDVIDNPTFNDVTISKTPDQKKSDYLYFIGTFAPVTIEANDNTKLYLGANNTLYYPAADVNVNAFRGYFELQQELTAGNPMEQPSTIRAFELNFDGEETAITTLIADEGMQDADTSWYTLDGRRLNGKPVTKGIYINRGRKIVIK